MRGDKNLASCFFRDLIARFIWVFTVLTDTFNTSAISMYER